MNKSAKSVTLVELLIAMMAASVMVLSFYGFVTYGQRLAMGTDRRAKVQNGLAYCLEHMSKYVQQANGNITTTGSDLQVGVDFGHTPSDFSDDALISYSRAGNNLSVACAGTGCPVGFAEVLSDKVTDFTVVVQGNLVDVSLTGQYNPSVAVNPIINPQAAMRTRLICNSSSTN